MNRNQPTVDTESIEHLDFRPKCETVMVRKIAGVLVPTSSCGKGAVWVAIKPCCGDQCFTCQPHRPDPPVPRMCRGCNTFFRDSSTWQWVRI